MSKQQLQAAVEAAWDARDGINSGTRGEARRDRQRLGIEESVGDVHRSQATGAARRSGTSSSYASSSMRVTDGQAKLCAQRAACRPSAARRASSPSKDAIAVASYVAKFRDEFLAHIEEGRCPFGGASSLEGIVAPTDVHEAHVGPAEIHRPLEVVA